MKKVCFIETSHDQRDLISILASKAKINDFDSSLYGVPSIVLGKSVYHNERKVRFTLSSKQISYHNSLIGFENREWVDSSVDKLFNFLKVI
jgi:hypothetical protein